MQHPAAPSPDKAFGLPTAIAIVMGSLVGIGIFTLPAVLASYGFAGIAGFALATIGALALASVFATLSRRYPDVHGGPYAYAREGFGDVPGFLSAFSYWNCAWPGNASIAISWTFYVQALFGLDTHNRPLAVGIAVTGLWTLALINLRGVRLVGAFQMLTVVLKFLPIVFLSTVGLVIAVNRGTWPAWNSSGGSTWHAISGAITMATFTYIGLESASIAAKRVHNPARNVAIATLLGTGAVAVMYLLLTTALFGLVDNATLRGSGAPFTLAFDDIFGGTHWGKIVAAFAVISGLGGMNGWTLLTAEVPFAAARHRLFPRPFASVNANGAPAVSIVVSTFICSIAVIYALGTSNGLAAFNKIALMSIVNAALPYLLSTLLHLTDALRGRHAVSGITIAREATIGVIGIVFCFAMIIGAGRDAVFLGFLMLMVSLVMMAMLFARPHIAPAESTATSAD